MNKTTPLDQRVVEPSKVSYEVVRGGKVIETAESLKGAKALAKSLNGNIREIK